MPVSNKQNGYAVLSPRSELVPVESNVRRQYPRSPRSEVVPVEQSALLKHARSPRVELIQSSGADRRAELSRNVRESAAGANFPETLKVPVEPDVFSAVPNVWNAMRKPGGPDRKDGSWWKRDIERPEISVREAQVIAAANETDVVAQCLRSSVCLYCQLFSSIPFFMIAAIATHWRFQFTPVYKVLELQFGDPEVTGNHMNGVDLKIPLKFQNPNLYPIQIHERLGTIFLPNSRRELGHFQVPRTWVPPNSEVSFVMTSQVVIHGISDALAVFPEWDKQIAELWFVAEELECEALVDLFTTELDIEMRLGRACSAKFNAFDMSAKGGMFCSENRTQLAQRIPAPDLLFSELTSKYEEIKNTSTGAMMAVGYLGGGILLFLASLTYESMQDKRQSQEA